MTDRLSPEFLLSDAAAGAVVLRGVAVAGVPRLIGRPTTKRTTLAVSAVAPAAMAAPSPPASASPVQPDPEVIRRALADAFEKGQAAVVDGQRQAGFEEGLHRGLQEGRASGERDVQQRLGVAQQAAAERLRRLDELGVAWAKQWSLQLAARLDAAEDDMVALCHGVICRLLGDALIGHGGVVHCVRAGIEQWLQSGEKQSRDERVVVHVHPLDLDAMKADDLLAEWLVQQGVKGLEWQASDEVEIGGCIVQSVEGDLDARLETQLSSVREQLLRGRTHGALPAPASEPAATPAFGIVR